MNFFRLCEIRYIFLGLIFLYFTGGSLSDAASFQGLGTLPRGDGTPYIMVSRAFAVSGDGSTVSGDAYWVTGGYQAHKEVFRWTASTGMEGLGIDHASVGCDVSSDGSVVVGCSVAGGDEEAHRWTAWGGVHGLGDLPGGGFTSYARGVSADGSVVVGRATTAVGMEAFRWESDVMTGLGELRESYGSRAYGVSADGSVVVGQSDGRAFRWTASDSMQALNGLPHGGAISNALAISANGLVVVGWSGDPADIYDDKEAFRWKDGAAVGLGDLPGGQFYSLANDVSANGSVVVGYSVTHGTAVNGTKEAFIWDAEHEILNLKELLVSECGLDLTGWTLTQATAISDNGLTIVGYGTNPNGFYEGWIAEIPEPCTLSLLALGSLVLWRKRELS